MNFFVFILDIFREVEKELGFYVKEFVTVLIRADDLLKHVDFVEDVVLETRITIFV